MHGVSSNCHANTIHVRKQYGLGGIKMGIAKTTHFLILQPTLSILFAQFFQAVQRDTNNAERIPSPKQANELSSGFV